MMMMMMMMAMMRVESLQDELLGYVTVLQMVKTTGYSLIQIESQNNGIMVDGKCVGLHDDDEDDNNYNGDIDDQGDDDDNDDNYNDEGDDEDGGGGGDCGSKSSI